MLGNERRPSEKHIQDYFREYNLYMEEHNINAYVVEIEVPQLICVTGLGNLRVLPKYDGPKWRADDNAVDIVREKDDVKNTLNSKERKALKEARPRKIL